MKFRNIPTKSQFSWSPKLPITQMESSISGLLPCVSAHPILNLKIPQKHPQPINYLLLSLYKKSKVVKGINNGLNDKLISILLLY